MNSDQRVATLSTSNLPDLDSVLSKMSGLQLHTLGRDMAAHFRPDLDPESEYTFAPIAYGSRSSGGSHAFAVVLMETQGDELYPNPGAYVYKLDNGTAVFDVYDDYRDALLYLYRMGYDTHEMSNMEDLDASF